MNLFKLFLLSASLAISFLVYSQDIDTVDMYYDFDLIPTGELSNGTDTVYSVTVVMDTTDVHQYTSITIENTIRSNQLSVTTQSLGADSRIQKRQTSYLMNMDKWSDLQGVRVIATNQNGTRVMLKRRPGKTMIEHKVITLESKRRNLKLFEGVEIVEQEEE